ncbi:MAG: putative transglutaminase-like cysteine proteinase [Methylophilaceae bacterium]|jgi:predicted transglutaminase-like cysteine proteinase
MKHITFFCCFFLLLVLGLAIAADLQQLANLAELRYGNQAKQRILALESLFIRLQPASESDQLEGINAFFNHNIYFVSDQENWGVSDYWATPLESLGKQKGDCEDYSIAKYTFLRSLGVPDKRLKMTYVKAQIGGPHSKVYQAHMVLSYYETPSAEPVILDNLVSSILSSSRRTDLKPVFSFNSAGLWVGKSTKRSSLKSLSRWSDVLTRIRNDGIQ